MPSEDDDADHDVTSTTTLPAATTSLPPDPAATNTVLPTAVPSDHPERPTKPTETTGDTVATPTGTEAAAETTSQSSWLPSFLPTFGVSSSTQAWIYGALGLIVAFCAGLGAWFWFVRRKQRLNNPRDDYEFEPLNADDGGEGLGAPGEKGQKRRAGELYDAFAGGSEDEGESSNDHFSIASHDEDDDDDDDRRPGHAEKQSSRLLGDGR